MKCDFLTLSEIQELSSSTYSDSLTMKLYDSTADFISQYLGHSFGQGMRIWHDGTGATLATFTWTVAVTSTGIILSTTNPASSTTLLFATYPTLREMAHAIQSLSGGTSDVLSGWEAAVAFEKYTELSSSFLSVVTEVQAAIALGNTGYAYRKVFCLDTFCETLSGNGESRLFLRMPIASISSVTEDGIALTAGTDYWAKNHLGVLIRAGSAGCCYVGGCRYTTGCWSMRQPNNVTVVYSPTWFSIRPMAIVSAIHGLMVLAMSTSGYQSERIGDYSYAKDGASALMWLQTLESYVSPLSIF